MLTPRKRATQIVSARTPPCWAAFLFLASALFFAGCASSPDDPFEANRRQAVKDSQTPEARSYEREFYPAIGQDMANLLKKCTSEFPAEEIDSFEMVFRIDHWGEPKAVLVNPVTDVSSCVAKGFWYFKFPHPDERFAKTGMALLLPVTIK
jgi:hypothetical protein